MNLAAFLFKDFHNLAVGLAVSSEFFYFRYGRIVWLSSEVVHLEYNITSSIKSQERIYGFHCFAAKILRCKLVIHPLFVPHHVVSCCKAHIFYMGYLYEFSEPAHEVCTSNDAIFRVLVLNVGF